MTASAPPRPANRLARETSPYLLQHAHNPVDWYPWGEEALRRARDEDRPILLSIGYASCHWCHVMERESFEDEAIAALMNEHFVSVKVDREERPDLDEVYMAATQALNGGQGGWPMTVFLTPEREPFFAGTYFPPEDRWGRPGFPTVLRSVADAWREGRGAVRETARRLTEHLRRAARPAPPSGVGLEEIGAAVAALARDFDPVHGGFGPAPKFPPASALGLLLRHHRRTGDEHALAMVRRTLDGMAAGGIRDHVAGGFCRYSTDERWLVPHFEKMLYDNALLARAYLEGWQATGEGDWRDVAAEVLDYLVRDLTGPEGGLWSSTDADSEGEEGRFFVWTPAQVEEVLGPEEARRFCAAYDVTDEGNWEGRSIPNRRRPEPSVAAGLSIPVEELRRSIADALPRLAEARRRRVQPALDDKILTSWNGLAIGALAEGARALGERRWLEAAAGAATFVLERLSRPDGGLHRTWRAGRASLDGVLEDYAYLTEGLLDLYEAGGNRRWLDEALRLAERMAADFGDDAAGGFWGTARSHEPLIVRHREGADGATPSPNAVAASVLARLSFHFDRPDLRARAVRAITAHGRAIARWPRAFTRTLSAADFLLDAPVELAFAGDRDTRELRELEREVGRRFLPNRVVGHHDPARGPSDLPLLAGKDLVRGTAALYVCRNFSCAAPVVDRAGVERALAERRPETTAPRLGAREAAVPGTATPEGTRRHAERGLLPDSAYAVLGRTNLTVSRVGFGGYRVDEEAPEHREALVRALEGGVNLVDTAANYAGGGSERVVGETLRELIARGALRRDEVVVVSKLGYLQGADLARHTDGSTPDVITLGEGVGYSLDPDVLRAGLERSLERLGLETLDVLLLHDPEELLGHARRRGVDPEAAREELDLQLRRAFASLEEHAAEGRIRWYGVSSNTVAAPASDPEATSLARMLDAARAAGGDDHRFAVLQLPFNVLESEAALAPASAPVSADGPSPDTTPVLDLAARAGVAVLANRPLNAFAGGALVRLADFAGGEDGPRAGAGLSRGTAPDAAALEALEAEFRRDIAPAVRVTRGSVAPSEFFRWAARIPVLAARADSLERWTRVEQEAILPQVGHVVAALDRGLSGPPAERWASWRERYLAELDALLEAARTAAALRSRARLGRLAGVLDPLLPENRRGEPLARKALWLAAGTPGVGAVLNGMRRPEYVKDALEVLRWPAPAGTLDVLRAVSREAAMAGAGTETP
ncbi:MAG TPA: aldo/keto reductase [Gemmatimonadota bacterium]